MTEADLPERPELENPDSDAARIDQQNSGSMMGGQMGAAGDGNVQTQGNNNLFIAKRFQSKRFAINKLWDFDPI